VKVSVDGGSAEFEVPPSLDEYFPTTTFTTSIKLPQVINCGVGYRIDTLWRFAIDVNYVGWSSYDTLSIDFADNTDKLLDIHSPRMYHDAFIFRLGAERKFRKGVWLRLGAYYDMSPVDAGYLTPETPDTDKLGITSGATIRLGSKSFLDLSFLYIEGMKRTDTNIETQFGGTYKTRAFVPGFGLEFQF
jgi:long-chain fatty acid transport protein